jgi:hypothetical protein
MQYMTILRGYCLRFMIALSKYCLQYTVVIDNSSDTVSTLTSGAVISEEQLRQSNQSTAGTVLPVWSVLTLYAPQTRFLARKILEC